MRWWGWGDDARAAALPAHALRFLASEAGIALRPCPPVALASVRLPDSSLREPELASLREIVGEQGVRDDRCERIAHAAGRGYPDLVRLRAGEPDGAPDAVVLPGSHAQLRVVLELCARRSIAVVPFGGGTSVVGGVAPLRGEHAAVLALDMRRMAAVLELDARSRTVTVEAGVRAAALERQLARRGLTLGHFPQSFEYVSLGGCVATRSAGQASSGYGAIETMVLGLHLAAPAGDIELPAVPASAAGPGLRQLLVGSEGTLGVLDRLALRVRPAPRERIYEGFFFADFSAGLETLRALAQEHALPEVGAAVRRGRDAHLARARRPRQDQGPARARLPRPARVPGRVPRDPRLRGSGGRARGQAHAGASPRARRRRPRRRSLRGRGVVAKPLRRSLPAR
jgi:alkyldihydroxyacetonephosphate synthase